MKRKILFFLILLLSFSLVWRQKSATAKHNLNLGSYKGIASWYSQYDPGVLKTTANMEIYDHNQLTCAMWDIPFGTILKVTNLTNSKSVVVRVNDRGPAKRLVKRGRIVDLSKRAFSQIAPLEEGLVKVKVSVLSQP